MRKIITYKKWLIDILVLNRDSSHLTIFGLTVLCGEKRLFDKWLQIRRPLKPVPVRQGSGLTGKAIARYVDVMEAEKR